MLANACAVQITKARRNKLNAEHLLQFFFVLHLRFLFARHVGSATNEQLSQTVLSFYKCESAKEFFFVIFHAKG
jgi:hypothetical protein